MNESVSKFRKNSIENRQERRWVERPTRLGRKAWSGRKAARAPGRVLERFWWGAGAIFRTLISI